MGKFPTTHKAKGEAMAYKAMQLTRQDSMASKRHYKKAARKLRRQAERRDMASAPTKDRYTGHTTF
jgi:hypothetical protein